MPNSNFCVFENAFSGWQGMRAFYLKAWWQVALEDNINTANGREAGI